MMKYFISVLGCICIFLAMTTVCQAAVFSNEINMQADIPEGTWIIGLGETSVQGSMYGYKNEELMASLQEYADDPLLSSYIDTEVLDNPHVFPITGSITFENIENITILPVSVLESISVENALQLLSEIQFFSDVSITINQDLNVLLTSGNKMDFHLEQASMLSGIIPFSLGNMTDQMSFFSLSDNDLTTQYYYDGSSIVLYPYFGDNTISIYNGDDNLIWDNQNGEYIAILSNAKFSFSQLSTYHIFPLIQENDNTIFSMRLKPAETPPNINTILASLQNISSDFDELTIPFATDDLSNNNLFNSISSLLNGGLVFVNFSEAVNIDESDQSFENIGFNRVEDASITLSTSQNLKLDGEFRLIFLGDHIYNPQAQTTENGVTLPIIPIILWGIAITMILYFYITKIQKEPSYKIEDKRIFYGCIIIHIAVLLIAFILYDFEISYLFGNSFMKELSTNGFTMIGLIFGGLQLVMWVIGFLFAALPLRIIFKKIMMYFGFDKGYQHIGKGMVSLSIWPIATIYTTMFINIIFLFFNPLTSIM